MWCNGLSRLYGNAGVLYIEDGLYQQGIDAAIGQCLDLLLVGSVEQILAEWLATGGYGGCATSGANGAGNEAGLVRRTKRISTLTGQAGCRQIDVAAVVLQAVVAHGDALGVERIGLDDVGTSLQILAVNVAHHEGTRQRQHVVAALQVVAMTGEPASAEVLLAQVVLLNHGAHSTVEHEDFWE